MSPLRTGCQVALLAAVYLVTARMGLAMDPVGGFATLVWPPAGISLAALLLFGYRLWPGVALGALLSNFFIGAPVLVAAGVATGNTLEALVAAYALRRIADVELSFERLRDVFALLVVSAGSAALAATIGVATLNLGGLISAGVGATWRAWWIGDFMADVVIAPLILVWWARRPIAPRLGLKRLAEAGALTLSLLALGTFVFGVSGFSTLFIPPLIWAALRFGQRGVVTTTFAVSLVAVSQTAMGHGPFVRASLTEGLTAAQIFMAVVAANFLILGAAIAERRRSLEAEKRARGIAEEAVRAREAFLSVASHELRNPLGVLHLTMDLLEGASAKVNPERAARAATTIRRQVLRLTQLVDYLLDATRLRAGKLYLECEEVDLTATVRDAVSRADEELRRAGCTVELHAEGPMVGRWDPVRLDQIATNLLSNAIKYGAGRPIEVRVDGDSENARLVVRDHGIGIAQADQARIFEQFERVDSGRSGGLGLGLWIVHQIAAAFGGSIRVASELGHGAAFTVELPRLAADRPAAASPAIAPEVTAGPEGILVVDDDPDALDALTAVLRAQGYSVFGAANGQAALDYLQRGEPPGVILLDLVMPVMNGFEFLRAKEAVPRLSSIPVVLISAVRELELTTQGLPVAGCLPKPIDRDRLVAIVERHCGNAAA